MAERIVSSPENRGNQTPDKEADKQYERLAEQLEKAAEKEQPSPEQTAETARHEALEQAASVEKAAEKAPEQSASKERIRRGPISKKDKEASFKKSMKDIQSDMSAPQRTFSKVIHNKTIEKTSEVVGTTIARPNAILSGSIAAFAFTLIVLLVARHYGYPLSGFESIGAFVLGWIVGQLFDFMRTMITGKR